MDAKQAFPRRKLIGVVPNMKPTQNGFPLGSFWIGPNHSSLTWMIVGDGKPLKSDAATDHMWIWAPLRCVAMMLPNCPRSRLVNLCVDGGIEPGTRPGARWS